MEIKETINNLSDRINEDFEFVKDVSGFWVTYGNIFIFMFLIVFSAIFIHLTNVEPAHTILKGKLIAKDYKDLSVYDTSSQYLVFFEIDYKKLQLLEENDEVTTLILIGDNELRVKSYILHIAQQINEDETVDIVAKLEADFYSQHAHIIRHNYPIKVSF